MLFACLLACLAGGLLGGGARARAADGAPATASDSFPVTVEHAFGKTVVNERPKRIATVGWGNQEVPLALGIVPVGMAKVTFGDDDGNGILPWVEKRIAELGGEAPVLFDESDGIDFEAIAATRPDVILAAYSGLSRDDYDILSRIAPVIAYPSTRWTTSWREMIRLDSAGIGMAKEGEALIAKLEARIAQARSKHPELDGKTAIFINQLNATDLSRINFYSTNDTRVKFFSDLGLRSPDAVRDASTDGKFSGSISAERIDTLNDVDIVVTYGGEKLMDAVEKNPLLSKMPAIRDRAFVLLGDGPAATAANPTPLSIPWGVDGYVDRLAKAVDAAP